MTGKSTRALAGAAALLGATLCAGAATQAAEFPTKTVTLVVAYAAGGGTDILVRGLSEPLAQRLGQQVLVQNVPGAGGGVAAVRVAREPADGHMLLVTTSSTFSLEPQLPKTGYKDGDCAHVVTERK